MKLPALLIAISVAAGVLAASPIAVHLKHDSSLSLTLALSFIVAGIVLLKFRQAHLAWSAGLLAWFFLAAGAAQIERIAVSPNQVAYRELLEDSAPRRKNIKHTGVSRCSTPRNCSHIGR